jgi:hypothetical protein
MGLREVGCGGILRSLSVAAAESNSKFSTLRIFLV